MKKVLKVTALMLTVANLLLGGSWQTVKIASTDMSVNKASFIDANTGWIVYSTTYPSKQMGKVQKTTDGGANWTTVREPDVSANSWNDMEFIDANVGYACGNGGIIYKTTNGGSDWTMIGDTNTYKFDLYSLDVVNANVVYCAGKSGTVLKTIDGSTFTKLSYNFDGDMTASDETRDDLDGGIAFFDENRGVVAVDFNKEATIWWTEDGGTNWHPVKIAAAFPPGVTSYRVYDVAVGGDSTVALACYHRVCLVSTNGGRTFANKGVVQFANVYTSYVEVFDNNTIIYGGGSDNFGAITTNGGTDWTNFSTGTGQRLLSADFIDARTGYWFCEYQQWMKTADGGVNWIPINNWPGISWLGLAFPDEKKIVLTADGGGEMTFSNDWGKTWSYPNNLRTGLDGDIFECEFIDANNGLIGGSGGYILKTTDGGATFTQIDNPMYNNNKAVNAMHYLNSDTVFVGGGSGYICYSFDGGDTWTKATAGSKTVYDIWPLSNNAVVATCANGEYYTSTDLMTFTKLGATSEAKNLRAVEFRNGIGIIPGASGYIYRSTAWDAMPTLVYTASNGAELYDVEFVDDNNVFVVGQYGTILKSEDAGLNWTVETSPTDEVLQKVRYSDNGSVGILWAVGQNGTILKNVIYSNVLAGDYYIPQGAHEQGFATLGAAITALNTYGAIVPVTFYIDADLIESGSELIIDREDLTAETALTIKPASGKTSSITINNFPTTGNYSGQGFTIKNTAYVTIDGSNTSGGTSRDLTIIGNDVNGKCVIGVIDNSDFITVKNVNITFENLLASGSILGVDGYTGVPNSLLIKNCQIGTPEKTVANGVALRGNSPETPCGAVVMGCDIYAAGTGIMADYISKNAYINNVISIINPLADQTFYSGMYLNGFAAGDTCVVFNNRIVNVEMNTTAPQFAGGLVIGENGGVIDIFNNFIAMNTTNNGSATDNRIYGIGFSSANWSGEANIYHNTIDIASTNQTGVHAAIGTEIPFSAKLHIYNNILSNRHDAANSFGIHWHNTASPNSVLASDYNDIYIAGSSASVGLYGLIPRTDLATWRAASGQDANSINKPVNFVSATDLHVTGSSIGDNDLACHRPAWLSTDIDGDARPNVTYMGADEGATALSFVGVANGSSGLPTEFSLRQNYPNPFNPTTVIAFALPKSTQVTLMVYNMLGQPVAVLQNGFLKAGYYHVNFDASNLPSGTYIYRIQAGDYRNVKKMTIVK
ncbi:MAG: T9SS type A sorting domain-containing protein [Candidatus Marinimicrobia bacterium]|nr:T9SS type A sorting domain-containing protein [Candidatus Neomarinimicrobiota bacterium]